MTVNVLCKFFFNFLTFTRLFLHFNGFLFISDLVSLVMNIILFSDSPTCETRQTFKYAARLGETISIECKVQAFPAVATTFDWIQNKTVLFHGTGFTESQESHEASNKFNYTVL